MQKCLGIVSMEIVLFCSAVVDCWEIFFCQNYKYHQNITQLENVQCVYTLFYGLYKETDVVCLYCAY